MSCRVALAVLRAGMGCNRKLEKRTLELDVLRRR